MKVVDNTVLKTYQETELYGYEKDYNELCELVELFMKEAQPYREKELKSKKKKLMKNIYLILENVKEF